MTRRPVPGQTVMDSAPEWSEAPGQMHLLDIMAREPERYCRCGHIAAVHETTDDEPGPCWHTTEDPPCYCDAFVPRA